MGKLGPLTSQALGRSPYDEVIMGEGEGDIRAPLQMYDERGRPVNPETKQINKDVIRSHNEVMLVIGVAEPENSVDELRAEAFRRREHDIRDERIGRALLNVGRALEIGGVWGVNGLRQRILLYRQYAQIPFHDLFQDYRKQNTVSSAFLAGLPAFAVSHALKQLPFSFSIFQNNSFLRSSLAYVRLHLQLWIFMQRMGLIASSPWLPSWKFFIPFSQSSPIPPPAPLPSLSTRGVLQWLGGVALSTAPFAACWLYSKLWTWVTRNLWFRVYQRMPAPNNRRLNSPRAPALDQLSEPTQAIPPQDTADTQPRNARDIPRDEAAVHETVHEAMHAHGPERSGPPPDNVPVGAVRRQSTFSNRRDDYISDDEDNTEAVTATLISFDVEATESTEAPTGMWSAELRPNVTSDGRSVKEEPVYQDNTLTRLPSVIAADIITVVASYVLTSPFEAFTLRLFARSFRGYGELPIDDIADVNVFRSFSWNVFADLVGLELVHFLIEADFWGVVMMLATRYKISDEEWNKKNEDDAATSSN
ncbi:hypothetical protein NKR23_g5130 [Pleurostoma richardsiae]|uniref:Uncharacterized protein n=1 Tax=Pleurostoma richardsiae TaxID=41990 RepID=A0AA38RUW4_9PEZI|nr:hypothetical protein NKR23_g5130 [Pleurostoma richardsiae]